MLGFTGLQEFLARGGPVLLVIMLATFVMWALIIERLFYFRLAHQAVADEALSEWRSRSDRKSKPAHWVKDKIVSRSVKRLRQMSLSQRLWLRLRHYLAS